MKKFIKTANLLFLTLSLGFSSCFSTKALVGTKYDYSFKLVGDHAKSDKTFDDGKILAKFSIGDKDVNFTLQNLTADPMKISWDEASLIIYGESKRIMHKGVKFNDRNSPQAPTVIPSNSQIDDLVLPTDNVYYQEGYSSIAGSWEQHDLFLTRDMNNEDTKKLIMGYKGKTFKFFLPIEQNGQKLNYTFEFEISTVIPITKS